jgi:uncharacterized membrane protein YhaH (DUF805 family)
MHARIDQPVYGIGPAGLWRFLRKYATFSGRASRSEFWWGQLLLLVVGAVLLLPGTVLFVVRFLASMRIHSADPATTPAAPLHALADAAPGLLLLGVGALLGLGLLVPSLALSWRRLQDAGVHGAWALALTLGGGLLATITVVTAVAPLVPGFLPSSTNGARFERDAHPVLPPGVDERSWAIARQLVGQRAAA